MNFDNFIVNLVKLNLLIIYALLGWILGVASITNIHHHSMEDNERLRGQRHGLNIFNNTSLMPSKDESPYFDWEITSRNVTVASGDSAFLICVVVNLGKNVVSWIRHSDLNVLSVGKLKYTQDLRFHALHNDITWTLKVH